jgi:hypothetical protein
LIVPEALHVADFTAGFCIRLFTGAAVCVGIVAPRFCSEFLPVE